MLRPRDTARITPDMLDPHTPVDVHISATALPPFTDPTLGIRVPRPEAPGALPRHRLVAIGDSLTHGFMSGAIHRTDVSAPSIVAYELGLRDGRPDEFRRPVYGGPGDGLPFNIEALLRYLETGSGSRVSPWEFLGALRRVWKWMDSVEGYWERGDGAKLEPADRINHNLGVYGWTLKAALGWTADRLRDAITKDRARNDLVTQFVEHDGERAGYRALATRGRLDLNVFGLARELGRETGDGGDPRFGIDTLLVMLGANHALETVVKLDVAWKVEATASDEGITVWNPPLFKDLLDEVVDQVEAIGARRVIWGTVPHVTIAPIARGVDGRVRLGSPSEQGSRYYRHYTRPWISDGDFDPGKDPKITHQQARAVDSAIDDYNDHIAEAVIAGRRAGRDWYLLDLAGLLDRLANRRYLTHPWSRPSWWSAYPLPPALQALQPEPTSAFFSSGASGVRTAGGLFSLDGVHPTTIGYGILAQEIIRVMGLAGVVFHDAAGRPRPAPVTVDFARLIREDTLISDPPRSVASTLDLIARIDERFPFVVDALT